MRRQVLTALNEERAARRPVIVVTDLASGEQRLVRAGDIAQDPLADVLAARLQSGKSGPIEIGGRDLFLLVEVPRRRLVVVGAVHIAQAMAPMAKLADLDMVVVDPRSAFATPERFPGIEVIAEWPQDIMPGLGLDEFTAVAVLTHNAQIDDPALVAALEAGCFYVGALGSQKTHGKRRERLRAAGLSDAQLNLIHAPIGLDIGAVSPAEIAISILAEMIVAMRHKPLRSALAA
jgi:xanthine dehydrogenase accessory factor